MAEKKFSNPTTQANYEADHARRVNADVDKDLASDLNRLKKIGKNATDRLNREIMEMVRYNDSILRFIDQYLRVMFDWGADRQLEFWEVGVDGSASFISHDGKTIMLKPCRTERNPNPLTGERRTAGGIILPKGI